MMINAHKCFRLISRVYTCVGSVCHGAHVNVKEFREISSLLPPRGSQGSRAGHQAWQQAPPPLEPAPLITFSSRGETEGHQDDILIC